MSTRERSWPVPVALVALSAIPLTTGTARLIQLAGGPAIISADHRFASFPLPLVVHIAVATTYALAGILQFVPRFRRRHLAWHRRAGRVLALAGLMVAISALWMTLFYQAQPGTGDLLYVLRLVFGSAMAACLVLGFAVVRRRDITAHRVQKRLICVGGGRRAEASSGLVVAAMRWPLKPTCHLQERVGRWGLGGADGGKSGRR